MRETPRLWIFAACLSAAAPVPAAAGLEAAAEGMPAVFAFTATLVAERKVSDPRARSFSDFALSRMLNVSCRMQAGMPSGIGPDGATPEQERLAAEARAAGEAAEQSFSDTAAADAEAMQREVDACGEDQACQMRVAMRLMNDPRLRNVQESAIRAQETMRPSTQRLADSVAAPVWQRWFPRTDTPACTGSLTIADSETYDRGIDGEGDATSPGTMTARGTAAVQGFPPDIWFNLEAGERRIFLPIVAYIGEVTKVDSRTGTAPIQIDILAGLPAARREGLQIGPEATATFAGSGRMSIALDGGAAEEGWQGAIQIEWTFTPE
jgi:hypothetical protein